MQEDRRKEIARRTQDRDAIEKDIQEQRRQIAALKAKRAEQSQEATKKEFNPSIPWSMYTEHFNFLDNAIRTEYKVDARDKVALEEALERLCSAYLREVETRQVETDKMIAGVRKEKANKLAQVQNLCRQLFPNDNIGQTMVKVLQLLVESPQNEIYYKDLVQNDFPKEQERRHNLGRVMTILKNMGLTELVLEKTEEDVRYEEQGDDGRSLTRTRIQQDMEGQLILRIKFVD
ncbi:hypothetical protein BGZ94_001663 [Podila epigama]|nr:hypothetical protein BGZ94_001663 [Podila epigama]